METIRNQMLQLLEVTRRETSLSLSSVDFDRVVYHEHPVWRVRDVVGHLGVWNGEAAQAIRAHAEGSEYHCILSEEKYDEYNGLAVAERRTWDAEQVWDEYESSSHQLKVLVETMPAEKWYSEMLYPWNERGNIQNLIEVMMRHEVEHREVITTSRRF